MGLSMVHSLLPVVPSDSLSNELHSTLPCHTARHTDTLSSLFSNAWIVLQDVRHLSSLFSNALIVLQDVRHLSSLFSNTWIILQDVFVEQRAALPGRGWSVCKRGRQGSEGRPGCCRSSPPCSPSTRSESARRRFLPSAQRNWPTHTHGWKRSDILLAFLISTERVGERQESREGERRGHTGNCPGQNQTQAPSLRL